MESPDIDPRTSRVIIDNEKGTFELNMILAGRVFDYKVDGIDSCEVKIDYQEPSLEERDSLQLTADRVRRWKDYYGYLYGLPMTLRDMGYHNPLVNRATFIGEEVLA